jgi:pimeloyl-ACP methyl ester carboxylesterase
MLALPGACARQAAVAPPGKAELPAGAGPIHRVLFIHGFRGAPTELDRFWLAAVQRLPARCEAYLVTGLEKFMGALDDNGPDAVVAALEAFMANQDIPPENLHLVAHSLGGLTARRFATLHPEAVRQVFMLGTPNGGVSSLGGLNLQGWCTPKGMPAFNAANPPVASVQWFVIAGDKYDDPTGGAFWEGTPNDGVIATASVMHFVALCGDSVPCSRLVLPISHPDWNWGENLLQSPTVINWVLDAIEADLARDAPAP